MADAAEIHDVTNDPDEPERPMVQSVLPPAAEAAAEKILFGRSAAVGATIGFVLVFTAVSIAAAIGGFGTGSAVGVGAFVGAWGGAGFGAMAGAILPLTRHLDAQPRPGVRASAAAEAASPS